MTDTKPAEFISHPLEGLVDLDSSDEAAELALFNEPAEPRFQAAMAFADGCKHTTQALNALALVLASYGDDEGSELLKVFARRMAAYEATVL